MGNGELGIGFISVKSVTKSVAKHPLNPLQNPLPNIR